MRTKQFKIKKKQLDAVKLKLSKALPPMSTVHFVSVRESEDVSVYVEHKSEFVDIVSQAIEGIKEVA